MNRFNDINSSGLGSTDTNSALRSYMLRVYNYMGFALILTGVIAYLVASTPALINAIYGTPLGMVVMFSPLVFILVLSFGVNKMQASTAQLLFWAFAGVNGVAISYIFLLYTGMSITRVFLITAATFLTMSIYGYTTKADLSKMGAILLMALIGIIIAMVVNIFMKSSQLDFAISIIGVIVFTGLTAWDTQKLKANFDERLDSETLKKTAIFGALSLYLNFLNLFLMLLRLIGDRRV
ncbi:MAG: Bax inhibitor-1/YccA family protein [Alphaproteobacteria bacterium]|jgi:FtsH-binding integral membrane protein|nr:Bax inhibitor-1/YccA family protein [Alphaproteobacteria bacterium]